MLSRCDRIAEDPHYRKGEPIRDLFARDREAMAPMPGTRFDACRWEVRKADGEGCAGVDSHRYLAGPSWRGRTLDVGLRAFDAGDPHPPRVHHQGVGTRDGALDRHGRRLLRQRHGRVRQWRVQNRARPAAQTLPRRGRPGAGDVPVGLVVELETPPPVPGLQDTGTGRNRVLSTSGDTGCRTMRAEQNQATSLSQSATGLPWQ